MFRYESMPQPSRLNTQRRHASSSFGYAHRRTSATTYDIDSGQVYSERIVPVDTTPRDGWMKECKGLRLAKPRRASGQGAASLLDLATFKVLREMDNLTAYHLEPLPLSLGRRLWENVQKSQLESLHNWSLFVSAFREIFQVPQQRFHIEIDSLLRPPTEYFRGLDSASTDWLTCLRVNPSRFDLSDLIRMANFRSLVVLDLSDEFALDRTESPIDERIFKSWTEMAAEGSFQFLRVILMRRLAHVSAWIFKYLDRFPALCFVVFTDCRLIHQRNRDQWSDEAAKYGWEARRGKNSARSLKALIDDKDRRAGAISGCYYHTEEILRESATDRESKPREPSPLVEAWLGNPKPWLHVIEDFPGTRTVWFDKTNPPVASHGRLRTPEPLTRNKRRRDVLSSPSSGTNPPAQKSTATMARQSRSNLGQILADLG